MTNHVLELSSNHTDDENKNANDERQNPDQSFRDQNSSFLGKFFKEPDGMSSPLTSISMCH